MAEIGDVKGLMTEMEEELMPAVEFLTEREILALNLPDPIWVAPMMFPNPGLVAVSGRPGSHKTYFCVWMLRRIAAGLPMFDDAGEGFFDSSMGNAQAPIPCLVIEEENSLRLVKKRLRGLKPIPSDKESLYFLVQKGFKLQNPVWLKTLLDFIEEKGIKVVLLDPFSSVTGLENENDNAEAAKVMDILRRELVERDLTVIFIHHPSKGDAGGMSLRGAGDILGKVDVHLGVEKDKEDPKLITVSYEKMRMEDETKFSSFQVRLAGDELVRSQEFKYVGAKKSKKEELTEVILAVFENNQGNPMTRTDVAAACGRKKNDNSFDKAWEKLLVDKSIHVCPGGKFAKTHVSGLL